MKEVALVLVLITGCLASVIEFVSLPKSCSLPSPTSASELRTSQLALLNANLLGLTAEPIPGFKVKSDLFSRPRAISVIRIDGIDSLNDRDRNSYHVEISSYEGISGSSIAQDALGRKVDNKIKTKIPVLYKELEHLYQLLSAVTAQKTKFEKSNTADAYHVTITGLA
ncbi:unnamed protein product, partial [Strongylus vulgaris]